MDIKPFGAEYGNFSGLLEFGEVKQSESLQKAVETYDAHAHYAGKIEAGRQPLAPISHIITNAKIEITVDEQGRFVDASIVDKADSKTIIPATEESAGRTRAACAHPLCEQVGYLSGQDASKFALYVEQLENWVSSPYSHAMLARFSPT